MSSPHDPEGPTQPTPPTESNPSTSSSSSTGRSLYRPIRPKGARIMAWVLLALLAAGTAVFVVVAPRVLGTEVFGTDDQVYTIVLMALLGWFLYRQATVSIVPSDKGVRVRNLFNTRELSWAQIVGVRYGPDHPWARLDLSDGTMLAAMGIQSSDGEFGRRESRRLATLLAQHEGREPEPTTPDTD